MSMNAAANTANAELPAVIKALYEKFGESAFVRQHTAEGMPTLWTGRDKVLAVLRYLRDEHRPRYEMLLDVTAIDERTRINRQGQPASDFTVVYHPTSFSGNCDIRIKVALQMNDLNMPTAIPLWSSANWQERETYDFFGILFDGHPNLTRILNVDEMVDFPLRKDFPLEDQTREDKDDSFFGR